MRWWQRALKEIGAILAAGIPCAAAGWLLSLVGWPLPWLTGPLLAMAALGFVEAPRGVVPGGRQLGQVTIGMALGLPVTPPVAAVIAPQLPWMVLAALLTLVAGAACGLALRRLHRMDPASAYFSSVPGGVAEMATQAARQGGSVPTVALAQSLRVVWVVLVVPPLLTALGITGHDTFSAPPGRESLPMLLGVLAAAAVAARLITWTGLGNAWLLGGIVAGLATALLLPERPALPPLLVAGAQLLMGMALGHRFTRDLLMRAPRLALASTACTALLLLLCMLAAALVSAMSGLPFATLALGTAPGGAAEMGITARLLMLGAPLVAAFHLVRMLAVVILAPAMMPLFRRLSGPT
jgi:membrane AbrB-like protein